MDRKEIVELLRDMANGPAAVYGTDALDAFAAAADLLAADGWVKCSERLPESRDDAVIVFFAATGSIETIHIQDYFDDITAGLDADGNQLYTKWYKTQNVTHWRPLPPEPDHD